MIRALSYKFKPSGFAIAPAVYSISISTLVLLPSVFKFLRVLYRILCQKLRADI